MYHEGLLPTVAKYSSFYEEEGGGGGEGKERRKIKRNSHFILLFSHIINYLLFISYFWRETK